jgi:hypothetical protein
MNNNRIITLPEAERILQFAKRIYPLLNGVYVEYGDSFAYYPNEFRITIPEEFNDERVGMKILKHVNEEFGATFEYNLREMSIQALLHECGHHMDFEGKIFTQRIDEYMMNDNYNRHIYEEVIHEFNDRARDYVEQLEEYEASDERDEEIEFALETKRIQLEFEDEELDELYRTIPTEYAADEFSARFFMTYLRPYKKCNYSL